ncbi:hypothetical protein NMY22_g13951 [Coprinellus aureogranulatus]|nr:hypothetical protein NMY22_g13951 [Coprinellus aureogranulatus]
MQDPIPSKTLDGQSCRIYACQLSPLRNLDLAGRSIAKKSLNYNSREGIPVLAPRISGSSRLPVDALVPRSFTPTVRSTDL